VSLRIMATADVHLGMKFASYRTIGTQLIDARFEALRNVVRAANERECNLLVVAGDLFHRVGVASAVILRATQVLGEFNGEVVAVLPGNHDFVSPEQDGLWSAFRGATGDRTLLLDSAGPYDLRAFDLDAILLAAPCDSLHGHDHRLDWMEGYTAAEGNPALIGIAHGSVDGLTLDAEGLYFPMTRGLLASLPPSLWVIGHTHRQHDLRQARLVVPGTPEPDGFDFPHAGQAAFIQIDGNEYSVEAVPTGIHQFADIRVNLDREQEIAPQLARAVPADALVRLAVSGMLDGARMQELQAELEDLRSRLPFLQDDISAVRRLVTQTDVDADYATGSFAHRLVSALLLDDDTDGAATAVELLSELLPDGSAR
jgi:DNA repair exonuclease SbcCD nuclease subunit